jgi:hypothetical protein
VAGDSVETDELEDEVEVCEVGKDLPIILTSQVSLEDIGVRVIGLACNSGYQKSYPDAAETAEVNLREYIVNKGGDCIIDPQIDPAQWINSKVWVTMHCKIGKRVETEPTSGNSE